ncbi:MAG: hypothetical protein JSS09_03280 [Verrucomicrobia bacterium]|nr:hypothetical protein [Verrucomicrobiota bacterium]
MIYGRPRDTASVQLLEKTGMSHKAAVLTNDAFGLAGTLSATALKAGSYILKQGNRAVSSAYNISKIPKVPYKVVQSPSEKIMTNSNSWTRLINPFKGKTFQEIDQTFRSKGFITKGPDPLNGKGSYFHPITNRKYYLDRAGKTYRGNITELPHVDVHYNVSVNNIEKQRLSIGERLYEFK